MIHSYQTPPSSTSLHESSALIESRLQVAEHELVVVQPHGHDADIDSAGGVLKISADDVEITALDVHLDFAIDSRLLVTGVEAVPPVRAVCQLRGIGQIANSSYAASLPSSQK